MLLLAGASHPLADIITDADGGKLAVTTPATATPADTSPAETSPAGMPTAERVDACLADQSCIDRYLWSLYQRTPKVDTVNVPEQKKVSVKRKGKTVTVTKTVAQLVGEDFAWKDPKAAELAGMSPMDYVIGGMDPGFRATLYRALRALDDAGFKPGVMCAFRDDYRQSIATGLKAQNDRSYHGGSFRGGYGHGMAADVVSVRGETRTERLAATSQLWDWIDAHEIELGIGRPYLDRDPPHVAPIDGEEYADHRLLPKMQHAESEARKHLRLVVHNDHNGARHTKVPSPSRAQAKARTPAI
jgi:phage-related protein